MQSTSVPTPRKKRFRKTVPSLERPVHVFAERELNAKLRMEEEEDDAYSSQGEPFRATRLLQLTGRCQYDGIMSLELLYIKSNQVSFLNQIRYFLVK